MMRTEKVAIVLATYQGEKYIAEQLDSLIGQTYTNWVAYIHDDGSKDSTTTIIAEYQKKYPEHFVLIEHPSTGGAKNNFMYLISQIEAPYLMCCDQDDVWLPNKIELTLKKMKEMEARRGTNTPLLVFTELRVVDQDLKTIGEKMCSMQSLNMQKTTTRDLVIQNIVTGCTMMVNRALQLKAKGNKPVNSEKIIMHDWWYALVAAEFGELEYIETPTILYRQHGDNSVGAKKITDISYILHKLNKSDEIKRSLQDTQMQADEFRRVFELEANHLISRYAKICQRNKIQRLKFYNSNRVWKSGIARNMGLIIWG